MKKSTFIQLVIVGAALANASCQREQITKDQTTYTIDQDAMMRKDTMGVAPGDSSDVYGDYYMQNDSTVYYRPYYQPYIQGYYRIPHFPLHFYHNHYSYIGANGAIRTGSIVHGSYGQYGHYGWGGGYSHGWGGGYGHASGGFGHSGHSAGAHS